MMWLFRSDIRSKGLKKRLINASNLFIRKIVCNFVNDNIYPMAMQTTSHTEKTASALLSNCGSMTSFRHGKHNIRFRTSPRLERYTAVKEWDSGYIVVMARYRGIGEVEDYIDLVPILHNLYINPSEFLKPIQTVEISYDEPQ